MECVGCGGRGCIVVEVLVMWECGGRVCIGVQYRGWVQGCWSVRVWR